jgi:hypothetical protein
MYTSQERLQPRPKYPGEHDQGHQEQDQNEPGKQQEDRGFADHCYHTKLLLGRRAA